MAHEDSGAVAAGLACREQIDEDPLIASPVIERARIPAAPGAPQKARRSLALGGPPRSKSVAFCYGQLADPAAFVTPAISNLPQLKMLPTLAQLAAMPAQQDCGRSGSSPGRKRPALDMEQQETQELSAGSQASNAADRGSGQEDEAGEEQGSPRKRRTISPQPVMTPMVSEAQQAPAQPLASPSSPMNSKASEQLPLPPLITSAPVTQPASILQGLPAIKPRAASSPAQVAWDDQHVILPAVRAIRTRSAVPAARGAAGSTSTAAAADPLAVLATAAAAPDLELQLREAEQSVMRSRAASLRGAVNLFLPGPSANPASPTSSGNSTSTGQASDGRSTSMVAFSFPVGVKMLPFDRPLGIAGGALTPRAVAAGMAPPSAVPLPTAGHPTALAPTAAPATPAGTPAATPAATKMAASPARNPVVATKAPSTSCPTTPSTLSTTSTTASVPTAYALLAALAAQQPAEVVVVPGVGAVPAIRTAASPPSSLSLATGSPGSAVSSDASQLFCGGLAGVQQAMAASPQQQAAPRPQVQAVQQQMSLLELYAQACPPTPTAIAAAAARQMSQALLFNLEQQVAAGPLPRALSQVAWPALPLTAPGAQQQLVNAAALALRAAALSVCASG